MGKIEEINHNIGGVLTREGQLRWWSTPIPGLRNRTPMEAINAGDIDQVVQLTRGYLNESFT